MQEMPRPQVHVLDSLSFLCVQCMVDGPSGQNGQIAV